MALFNILSAPDRSRTQLAYMLNYYPRANMPEKTVHEFMVWERTVVMPKYKITSLCNEELTHLMLDGNPTQFKIQWAFNNIPTETEWQRKGEGYLIAVELRISPVTGPVALLSFGTVKHINPAWSN